MYNARTPDRYVLPVDLLAAAEVVAAQRGCSLDNLISEVLAEHLPAMISEALREVLPASVRRARPIEVEVEVEVGAVDGDLLISAQPRGPS